MKRRTSRATRLRRSSLARIAITASLAAPLALGGCSRPAPIESGELRTVELSRQLGENDAQPLDVAVTYAAGRVVVHGADQPLLYQAQLAYDPLRAAPAYTYDAAARQLTLGVRHRETDLGRGGTVPELRLDLARTVPVALTFEMGAAKADLDLGGMRLTRLLVEAAASETELHFDTPNLVPMERLALELGTGTVTARGLANARARVLRLEMKLGSARLDFGGDWRDDMALELDVGVGSTTIRVPDDVGVAVTMRRTLGSFDDDGFEKRDDGWYSTNWAQATRRLTVSGRTHVGELAIQRGAN